MKTQCVKIISCCLIIVLMCSCSGENHLGNNIRLGWSQEELINNFDYDEIIFYDNSLIVLRSDNVYYFSIFGFNLFAENLEGINKFSIFNSSDQLLNSKNMKPISFNINNISKEMNRNDFEKSYGKPHFYWPGAMSHPAYITDTGNILIFIYEDDNRIYSISEHNFIKNKHGIVYSFDR